MAQQEAPALESVWTKEDISEIKLLTKDIIHSDWIALLKRHELGLRLLEKKRATRHGKFTEQLQILGDQIGYSYDQLQRFMRFARMFPEFEKFKVEYREDNAPSWNTVQREVLYEPGDGPSDSSVSALHYGRWVVNWSENRAWLEDVGLQICSKLKITKSQALEEGLILLGERERIPMPQENRGDRMPRFTW